MTEHIPADTTPGELAALLTQLGGVLLSTETVHSTVELVTRLATETIAGTIGAGVTLVDLRGKRSTAPSNTLVAQADQIQYDLDAGPCLTAWRDQTPVRIDDTNLETRWPEWTTAVSALGIRSILSVPLVTGGTSVGAIKVYSRQPDAYDARSEHLLALFAQQAAILLTNTLTLADAQEASAQVVLALDNRDIIGQAKGVLIAQGASNQDLAFAMLASASQRSNLKLHEVARQLVADVVSRNLRPAS
ncbi:MAG: GAF and ANTAR domain-containing protein [Janthinobacterium lividum]